MIRFIILLIANYFFSVSWMWFWIDFMSVSWTLPLGDRPTDIAYLFVRTANRFKSEITLQKGKHKVNGKSIMGLMMLALGPGSEFFVKADGKREEEALFALEALVERNFEANAT